MSFPPKSRSTPPPPSIDVVSVAAVEPIVAVAAEELVRRGQAVEPVVAAAADAADPFPPPPVSVSLPSPPVSVSLPSPDSQKTPMIPGPTVSVSFPSPSEMLICFTSFIAAIVWVLPLRVTMKLCFERLSVIVSLPGVPVMVAT